MLILVSVYTHPWLFPSDKSPNADLVGERVGIGLRLLVHFHIANKGLLVDLIVR